MRWEQGRAISGWARWGGNAHPRQPQPGALSGRAWTCQASPVYFGQGVDFRFLFEKLQNPATEAANPLAMGACEGRRLV
jgi:hypothetical protein